MKALVYRDGRLNVADIELPQRVDETLVRVTLSGICNTDLEIIRGYAGFEGTIGHEFVGVVESSPDAPDLVGKRVVGEINAGCGVCEKCVSGDARHCPTRTVLGIVGRDGAHAEYLSLPARDLLPVPDSVSDAAAVFVEPLAAAVGIAETTEIAKDTRVAVIGDGKLGLFCAVAARLRSDDVTLIGRHETKMKYASDRGVETVLDGETNQLHSTFDVVIEASGSESGFAAAVDLVKPRGTIVLKSTFHGEPKWPAARIVVDEITVRGSRCGRFEPALKLLADGSIDPTPLIDAEYPLADAIAAIEHAARRNTLKVLLRP